MRATSWGFKSPLAHSIDPKPRATGDVNWLAVIVATILYWVVGAVWYAPPVLGREWQKAGGVVVQEGVRPGPSLYVGTLVANFLSVVATAMIATSTGASDVGDGLVLGLVLGVGFGAAFALLGAVTETKPNARLGSRSTPDTTSWAC